MGSLTKMLAAFALFGLVACGSRSRSTPPGARRRGFIGRSGQGARARGRGCVTGGQRDDARHAERLRPRVSCRSPLVER
jgi:hypothetical protein